MPKPDSAKLMLKTAVFSLLRAFIIWKAKFKKFAVNKSRNMKNA